MFEIERKLIKSWPCGKVVGQSLLRDFLVTAAGQMVKTPPPPAESVSALREDLMHACPFLH